MDHQLTPAEGLSFFVTALFETVTRQAGFIVPTLFEPVTVSTQITGDSDSFRVARIQVYKYESVLVVVPPPPNGVKPVGGNKGGGKLEHQGEWVLVREVEGPGPISAYAGESVHLDIAFEPYADDWSSVQETYQATLTVQAPPLTFVPYALSAAVASVSNSALPSVPLYPLYGGEVKVIASVTFGASTYGTYQLVEVKPDPGGPIDIKNGSWQVELPSSQLVEFSIPITVGKDVMIQGYTLTFQESAYEGQQSQNFPASVTVAEPNFGI